MVAPVQPYSRIVISRIPEAVAVPDASVVLQLFDSVDQQVLTLFNRELDTLNFQASDEQAYKFSNVVMNGRSFQFNLCGDNDRKIPAVHRHSQPYNFDPMYQLLGVNLTRISIFDAETGMEFDPDIISNVEGGYNLLVED